MPTSPVTGALRATARLFQTLPEDRAVALGRRLGLTAHGVLPRRRAVARAGLRQALGDQCGEAQLHALCRRNFAHYGVVLAEFLRLPRLTDAQLLDRFTVTGLEHVHAARARGRGLIVLTAHVGNWEYLAAAQAAWGLDIAVITRHAHQAGVDRFWQGIRRDRGIRFLHAWRSLRTLVRHLRDGGAVGMSIDQNEGGTSGARVPFFGREAGTVKAPALLAARTGCPVIMALSWRDDHGRHHASFSEELPLVGPAGPVRAPGKDGRPGRQDGPGAKGSSPEADLAAVIDATTRGYNARLEAFIRAHPEQWTWVHRRWKPA